jgi:hypothetical protein
VSGGGKSKAMAGILDASGSATNQEHRDFRCH